MNCPITKQQASFTSFKPSMEQCIWLIKNAPDLYLQWKHGIILDVSQGSDEPIIQSIRKEYIGKSMWLEFFLLDIVEHDWELNNTDKINYKPFAERSVSFYKLAQEVYLKDSWAKQNIPSPATWMVMCEMALCKTALTHSGYLTGQSNPMGKTQIWQGAKQHYDYLLDVGKIEIQKPGAQKCDHLESLEQSAALIAQQDTSFRNGCYLEYIQAQKRCFRAIRNNPALHVLTLCPVQGAKILAKGQGKRKQTHKQMNCED